MPDGMVLDVLSLDAPVDEALAQAGRAMTDWGRMRIALVTIMNWNRAEFKDHADVTRIWARRKRRVGTNTNGDPRWLPQDWKIWTAWFVWERLRIQARERNP
jgi:hypothetical protein